jgi:hypothetical protein
MSFTNKMGGKNGLPKFAPGPRSVGGIRVRCGDMVREIDGRHVGRLAAISFPFAIIEWVDNGWRSVLPINEIEKVES